MGKDEGKANKSDILLGVSYRSSHKDEEADDVFYKRLAEVSQSLAFVLMGDFNFLDICWKYNTAERKQARRFLECVEEKFPKQLVSEPTRGGASLDSLFTNREGQVGHAVIGVYLGLRDREMIEFSVQGEIKKESHKTTTMDLQRAHFGLLRMLAERVPWERVLKGKGAQEQAVPMCHKTNQHGRRPTWLKGLLLLGLRKKRRVYHLWKTGQANQEEC